MLYEVITTVDKVRSSDTFGAGDDELRIGDIVDYRLTIPIPEGTLGNLQIVDTLPQGRITSYNVCYTKLLRLRWPGPKA